MMLREDYRGPFVEKTAYKIKVINEIANLEDALSEARIEVIWE